MEILNRITLKEELEKPARPIPVFVSARKKGVFGMSKGLYELMKSPEFIEFRYDDKKLYITLSDENKGFKISISHEGRHYTFAAPPVNKRFFVPGNRYVVFTEPEVIDTETLYRIRL